MGLRGVGRAFRDGDWPAAVGAAKEMCETIAKVVLATRHAELPSEFPAVISAAHRTLDRLPGTGTAGEAPVREMSQAARNLATALARLRNDFGTGHGRPVLPPTTEEHAALAVDGAIVWCRWALSRLDTVLSNTADRLIIELDSGEVFRTGVLADRLIRLDMGSLLDEDLFRLGRAVANRGVHRDTFVVRDDGILAALDEPVRFPTAYRRGLISGILVDANGYVRASTQDIPVLQQLVTTLDDSDFFVEFASAVEGADFSYATDLRNAVLIGGTMAAIAKGVSDLRLKDAWKRLSAKFSAAAQ